MGGYSVILLHHNKAAYSRACLFSLLNSTARPLEVVNVDNGSGDGTAEVLDEWEFAAEAAGVSFKRLNFETNIGAVAGRNEALKVAEGEFIAFLDNDTVVGQVDWLEGLRAGLESLENCGIVTPKLLFPWEPYLVECCGAAVSPSGRIQYLGRGLHADQVTEPREIQCSISAAWLMRAELVREIGMLDEVYSPVQYEDMDFCYRARQAGHAVWTWPGVHIYHFEHTTTAGSEDINFRYVTAKNGITFKKRWGHLFAEENGTTEAATAWLALPKHTIEEVDWHSLVEHDFGRTKGGA